MPAVDSSERAARLRGVLPLESVSAWTRNLFKGLTHNSMFFFFFFVSCDSHRCLLRKSAVNVQFCLEKRKSQMKGEGGRDAVYKTSGRPTCFPPPVSLFLSFGSVSPVAWRASSTFTSALLREIVPIVGSIVPRVVGAVAAFST